MWSILAIVLLWLALHRPMTTISFITTTIAAAATAMVVVVVAVRVISVVM